MKSNLFFPAALTLFLSPVVSFGQEDTPPGQNPETRFFETIPDMLFEKLMERLGDPDTYNKYLLERLLGPTDAGNFIRTANIKFLTMTSENEDHKASLGLAWDYSGTWTGEPEGHHQERWNFNFGTKGNVAFDHDINPADFLTISMSGTRSARFGGLYAPDDESISASIDWHKRFAEAENEEEFMNSRFTREYLDLLRGKAGNELYLEGGFNTAFETDQEFENYQTAFGAIAVLDYKAWSDSSTAARCNIFDYPAALGRWISGTDRGFTPSGASIPTLLLGADLVTPIEADVTVRGGDESNYFRLRAEVATKSLLAEILDEYVFLEMNVRIYQELDASRSVRNLGADQNLLYTIALTTTKGWYVSYSEGDLPFDHESDRSFGVGFKYSFN